MSLPTINSSIFRLGFHAISIKHGLMQGTKTVWLISDEKKGHENQSLGLIQALGQHARITSVRLSIKNLPARWRDLFWPSTRAPASTQAIPPPRT